MNCLFLCFVEFSLAIYISLAVIFSVVFASFKSYSFPSLLSIITSSSIFVFLLLIFQLVDISDSSFVLLNGLSLYSTFNIFLIQATTSCEEGLADLSRLITPYFKYSSKGLLFGVDPQGIGV